MIAHRATSSDILSTLVEVDFDKAYLICMMAESPVGSLFHVIYDCLYADYSLAQSSAPSATLDQQALSPEAPFYNLFVN